MQRLSSPPINLAYRSRLGFPGLDSVASLGEIWLLVQKYLVDQNSNKILSLVAFTFLFSTKYIGRKSAARFVDSMAT